MNVPFLKLRVASDAWLVCSRGEQEAHWPSFAKLACARASGAAASGVVSIHADGKTADAYNRHGQHIAVPPVAALCAARWLFDAGRSSSDTVLLSQSKSPDIEVITVDSRAFAINLGDVAVQETKSAGRAAAPGANNFISTIRVQLGDQQLTVHLFDGTVAAATQRAYPGNDVLAACISRERIRVYRRHTDALLASAAACAAASGLGLTEAECAAELSGGIVLVQKPDGASLVLLAEPEYCMSGEIWMQEGS